MNERERKGSGNQGTRYVPPHLRSGDSEEISSKQSENQPPGEFRENNQSRGGGYGSDRDFNNRWVTFASHVIQLDSAIDLFYETKYKKTHFSSVFTFPLFFFFRSNNNRRFNNNYQRGGGGGENFQQRGGDFSRGGGSDYNNHNNNNRYQNGDSERGGNWNNRGGSRTFSRSSGADNRFAGQGAPPQQQQSQPENGAAPEQPQDEPVNTRWQEPPQQDNYYNNRSSGAGYGGKWNNRGGEVDYTIPLPRDERVEQELFGTDNTGINFNKYEDIPVEATGKDVPEHIASFEDCKLTDIIRENVKMARYDKPTPVQKYAIPIILGGRDLMSCAQTGSG